MYGQVVAEHRVLFKKNRRCIRIDTFSGALLCFSLPFFSHPSAFVCASLLHTMGHDGFPSCKTQRHLMQRGTRARSVATPTPESQNGLYTISYCLLSRTANLAENNKTYPVTREAERFRARPDAKKCRFCGTSKASFYQILTLLRRDLCGGLPEREKKTRTVQVVNHSENPVRFSFAVGVCQLQHAGATTMPCPMRKL